MRLSPGSSRCSLVQTTISVRPGRIASASLRETIVCFALARPLAPAGPAGTGTMSPSARAWNLSTTYRSSARPVPKK